jgi:DNA-binding transcriptional regulator YdaS (Cro superfamily)
MEQKLTAQQRQELAEKVGLNEQWLYQCLSGRRDMSPAEAIRVEAASGGTVTRQMLCQGNWAKIWPELA